MHNIIVFADEYGNNSFDFSTQGSHFIVASVIFNRDKLKESEEWIEAIRVKHFQTGEIKSKKVADNHGRRIKILTELLRLYFADSFRFQSY